MSTKAGAAPAVAANQTSNPPASTGGKAFDIYSDLAAGDFGLEGFDEGAPSDKANDADGDDFLDLDNLKPEVDSPEEEPTESEEQEGEPEASPDGEDPEPKGDVEYIEVTTSEGKKKLKIDYGDKAATKRAYQQAAGVEKVYGRYKHYREMYEGTQAKLAEVQAEKSEAQEDWAAFEQIAEEEGIEGVLPLLFEDKEWWQVVLEQAPRALQLSKMTPEQRLAASPTAAQRKLAAENRKLKADLDKRDADAAAHKEQLATTNAQAALDKVFTEHSFAGMLGDAAQEEELDSFMFAKVQSELARYEEAGYELSEKLIRVVAGEVASTIPKAIRLQARKMMSKSTSAASKAATKAAQDAAVKGGERAAKAGAKADEEINWLDPRQAAAAMASATRRRR